MIKRLLLIISCGLVMWACGGGDGKKKPVTYADLEEQFTSTLTVADTTKVLTLAAEMLDSLKAGNVSWAVDLLCEVDTAGRVMPLSAEKRESATRRFTSFPVVDYELDYYEFSVPALNDLKYRTYFAERDESGRGPAIALMFNPVKQDGEWCLCLKEMNQPAKDASNAINPDVIVERK